MTRIGSLFSGYAGLDMGVQAVLGGDVAWHSENDPAACKVLAHHWPEVPNLGDITAVDWTAVEPVDVLTGGFPCTDVSTAGRRAGLMPGTRSGLWSHMRRAISVLQPRLVLIENVRGLLSAQAHRDVEPETNGLGDGNAQPVLRAIGAVLGDLSQVGYDAVWCGLRAADVGAPHGRYRVFIVATDTTSDRRNQGWPEHARLIGGPDVALSGDTPPGRGGVGASSSEARSPEELQDLRSSVIAASIRETFGGSHRVPPSKPLLTDVREHQDNGDNWHASLACQETPETGMRVLRCDGGLARTPRGSGPDEQRSCQPRDSVLVLPPENALARGSAAAPCLREEGAGDCGCTAWGKYQAAISRWEMVLGRQAPAPTQLSRRGTPRLSVSAVEWLMGLPDGHVTDVPGLTRNDQLRLLGNGVVPQQAGTAVTWLYDQIRHEQMDGAA